MNKLTALCLKACVQGYTLSAHLQWKLHKWWVLPVEKTVFGDESARLWEEHYPLTLESFRKGAIMSIDSGSLEPLRREYWEPGVERSLAINAARVGHMDRTLARWSAIVRKAKLMWTVEHVF